MPINRRQFINATIASTVLACIGRDALAQTLDSTRIAIGFTAGSTPDVLARKVAAKLAGSYARSAIVDNRPGAGGQLAVTAIKSSPANGTDILLTPMSILGVYPHTYRKLPYDPIADLTPVTMGVTYDYGIAVGTAVPDTVKTIADLMAWYKANPQNANIASPAPGSTLHFVGVMLGRVAGVELSHVGYRGSPQAIQDMLGGTLPALCSPLGSFTNTYGGKLRVLATTGAKRSRFMPNVPTLAEQGYKDMVFSEWYGFFLPAKASPEAVKKLNAALQQALVSPEITATLAEFAMEPTPSTPEQLAASLKSETQRWEPIVKSIGFVADR